MPCHLSAYELSLFLSVLFLKRRRQYINQWWGILKLLWNICWQGNAKEEEEDYDNDDDDDDKDDNNSLLTARP